MTTIDLNQLSETQLKEALKLKQEARKHDRTAYKELVNEVVPSMITTIQQASNALSKVKENVFSAFEDLLKMKADIYGIKETQQSHTFSDEQGHTIEIGYNVVDGWDDTVNSGIAKINAYIKTLAAKQVDADTITIIHHLLKRDPKGNLKSSRVLELSSLADKLNNEFFIDGVRIIKEAYRPIRTSFYINATTLDKAGNKINVPLNIASVPFPSRFDYSFILPNQVDQAVA